MKCTYCDSLDWSSSAGSAVLFILLLCFRDVDVDDDDDVGWMSACLLVLISKLRQSLCTFVRVLPTTVSVLVAQDT